MGFSELAFFFAFLPFSIVIYLAAEKIFHNDTVNNLILILLSLVFYFWADSDSVIVFIAICIFTYMAGWMVSAAKADSKKHNLVFVLTCLIGVLAFYKYIALLSESFKSWFGIEVINIEELIVPIGLSFVIFESISYVMDIYRGDTEAGSFLDCLTYLTLFSKLVSGPIVLWKDFKHQLVDRRINSEKVANGIDRIIIGYAKKVIIADTFGLQISMINDAMVNGAVDTPTIWLRSLLYFFQLYFDFSGYSDIAIGLSGIFGFEVKENFNYPYLSGSITEFWRRWHISLGSWFREYVYIPLGGNRKGNVYFNLMVVFLLTGIWHGAGWQFVLWGAFHGICVVIERAIKDKKWYTGIPKLIKWMVTVFVIYMSWILFMSPTLASAVDTYGSMFTQANASLVNYTWRFFLSNRILILLIIAVTGHLFGTAIVKKLVDKFKRPNFGTGIKRICLLSLFVVDILYVVNSTYSPFMYFQF